jgi:heat-inducible transcriptional repressor
MQDLTERQKIILSLVVHEHVRSAAPVGSQNLVARYKLDLSPATVRNEMVALTEMNYLRQPHTSAGREPTEEGYRYFVAHLLRQVEVPNATRSMISHQFYQASSDVEQWMRLAASILARQSQAASLVTAPHPDQARFKHFELISTHGRQILMVLVMMGGDIHQRVLTLEEAVSQEQLSSAAQHLNDLFANKYVDHIHALRGGLNGLELDVAGWLIREMESIDSSTSGEVFMDGMTNVLAEPEFSESDKARSALRVLEERSLLQEVLDRTSLLDNGGVQVLIGGEGTWTELSHVSIVLARYGQPGLLTGALGILGPIRMPYARSISTVRFMSSLLSGLVLETMGNKE